MVFNKRYEKQLIIPIILAGGSGENLWPLSRKNHPKALLPLINNLSLLQNALLQIQKITCNFTPIIIGNIMYSSLIKQQLKTIKINAIILLESQSHDTGAAVAIATQYALTRSNNPLLLIMPIDIYIESKAQFAKMIMAATKIACENKLVIFGVNPTSPSTRYGYIRKGSQFKKTDGFFVPRFSEKPNLKNATSYFKSGKWYWNSGIFLFQAATFLQELALYAPTLMEEAKKVVNKISRHTKVIHLKTDLMHGGPYFPIDKTIFENTKSAVVIPFKGGWHDLGNWNALYSISKKDIAMNVKTKNIVSFDTSNSYLYSNEQLLVTSGVNNLFIIVTKDVILVASPNKIQEIKKIVHYLIEKKYSQATLSPRVSFSWGYYDIIEKTSHQVLKHFFVNAHEKFSSIIKDNLSVRWICISGKAQVEIDKKLLLISRGKSINLTSGSYVNLTNTGNTQLNFIEISEKSCTVIKKS